MMEQWQILGAVAAVFILIVVKMIYDKLTVKKKTRAYLKKIYGEVPEVDYELPRYEFLDFYHKHKPHCGDVIDDITWNDLEMDDIFKLLNQTCTGIGEEYLYAALREPFYSEEKLKERSETIRWLDSHETERIEMQTSLSRLGKIRNIGVYQYCDYLKQAPKHNPALNIFLSLGLLVSIILTAIRPTPFIGLLLLFAAVNMIVYFTYKNKSFFDNFSYMSGITYCAQMLVNMKLEVMPEQTERVRKFLKPFRRMSRFGWLFVSGSRMGGTLLDLLMDYVKMMFHIDVILFDFVLDSVRKNEKELTEIMDFIGELDMAAAVASFRNLMDGRYCEPKFETAGKTEFKRAERGHKESGSGLTFKAKAIYHPLILKPVTNDIDAGKSVLVTGSNASGKSTFLKTVAVNAILAQTIYTVMAESYRADFFRIYSSMALRDNLSGGESYFIVEIKSLKRIVAQADKEIPMLCFIDEVLRGTNTIERIAASSQILNWLSGQNDLCFAATHDIELTEMLKGGFENYHFQETVEENQVCFDYKLYKGRAVSRNAIKLLGLIGFERALIEKAENAASEFEKTGMWKI